MDIEYLLFLQALREAAPVWLNTLLSGISEFAVSNVTIFLPCVVFWCISKETGLFVLMSEGIARGVNAFIKNTFCVYRPWIRDSRVQSSLMTTATGYSFPSGHTTRATAFYGGFGYRFKEKTKKIWPFIVCLIPALITGFARNWVGAHTPQDVVVGFLATLAVIFFTAWLLRYLDKHPNNEGKVTLIAVIIAAVLLIYIVFKPYPLDYNADGTLLVDPVKMMKDAFSDTGSMVGTFLGWYLEKRYVRFDTQVDTKTKVLRGVIGYIVAHLLVTYGLPYLSYLIPQEHALAFLQNVIEFIYLIFLYPLLFQTVEKRMKPKTVEVKTKEKVSSN